MKEQREGIDYSQVFNKKIFIVGMILFCVLIGVYLYSPFFPLQNIEILGNNSFTVEQVVTKGEIDTTKNIYLISTRDIEKKLMEDPYVQKVRVRKNFPRSLSIEIYVRQPIATINFTGGFAMIDADCNILKIEQDFSNTVKPLITGIDVKELEVGTMLNIEDAKSAMIVEIVKNVQSLGILQNLTQINIADINNISMLTTQGITVLLGDGENLNDRLLKLNQILVDLHTKGISTGYVDMRFNANPVYRAS